MSKLAPKSFIFKTILILTLTLLIPLAISGDEKKKIDFWLPMEERIKTWDAIAGKGNYTISSNGLEATYEKDGAKWTIIGANAPIVNPTVYPKDWPVKGEDFEVLVIPEPITNYKILPFTEKIENAVKSDTISITAAKDSYEPASFVIRSGDVDLKNVMIEISDLKAEIKGQDGKIKTAIIPKENVDVRVVKCWYQAGDHLYDTKNKMLKPELLLHDDDIVRVDYENQVNLLKNYERIQDSEKLKPFIIPKKKNKQIWLTANITKKKLQGMYKGNIKIVVGKNIKKLNFEIEILPFILPDPMLDYVLYYEGYLSEEKEFYPEARRKTEKQMMLELKDMKEHGLTNATVWHQVSDDKSKWDDDWKILKRTLDVRKNVSWGSKPLLYLDWKMIFKEDLINYKKKVESIIAIAKSYGINDIYIYGADEKKGADLYSLRPIYKTVHEAGAKNFVACMKDFLIYIPDLLDLPVLWSEQNKYFMNILKKLGIKAWRYSNPQAGLEDPDTYRSNYGIKLLVNGFAGACNYQYQRGAWNDFADPNGRMNTMAYPTVSNPVPTKQWEGWREGVDDIRYLTLLKNNHLLRDDWLNEKCSPNIKNCRKEAIKMLIEKLSK